MKHLWKRTLSAVLALCMCLQMTLAASPLAANEEAQEPPQTGEPVVTTIQNDDPAVVTDTGEPGPWISYPPLIYLDKKPDAAPATVTVTFTGSKIVMYGQKSFNGPILTVEIDGKAEPVEDGADFFAPSATAGDVEVWSKGDLVNKEHTLVFTFGAEKNTEAHPDSIYGKMQAAIHSFVVTSGGQDTTIANNDDAVAYDTGVAKPWDIADGYSQTDRVGATMTVPFTGNGIAVQGKKLPTGYILSAAIDGAEPKPFDTYAAEASAAAETLCNIDGLTDGGHELVLTVTDEKHESAGTAGIKACIDSFLVTAAPEEPDEPEPPVSGTKVKLDDLDTDRVIFSTGDKKWTRYDAENVTFTNAVGATIMLEFTGPNLTLYGNKAGNGPMMSVTIDGEAKEPVNFYGSGKNIKIWEIDDLENAAHTAVFTFLAERGDKPGTPFTGNLQAAIDYFEYTETEIASYDVSGTVTDKKSGSAIEGATVTIGKKTAVTGENGAYSFTGDNQIPAGKHTAVVTKDGYLEETFAVMVSDGPLTGQNVKLVRLATVSGTVTDGEHPVADALVKVAGRQAVTGADGKFTVTGVAAGTHTLTVTADGYEAAEKEITVTESTDLSDVEVTLTPLTVETATLSTAAMDVLVDKAFPRVISYAMKGGNGDKVFQGQSALLDTIRINGVDVKPTVTPEVSEPASKITYTMAVKDEPKHIDATITAEIEVAENTLEFRITNVTYTDPATRTTYPIESIEIPDHSLISVRSNQAGANLAAARLGGSTIQSGDTYLPVDENLNVGSLNGRSHMYVFLSNDELSAGISGNSDVGRGAAAGDNYRITLSAQDRGAYKTVGAGSSLWYYDRKISSSDPHEASNANLTDEKKVVGIRANVDEMPYVKVVITADENGDDAIDWQDGAIAARETETIHIPAHSDSIPDLISTRISMNFQSEAANPFLTALDNVKRVALHSDGLGQSILLKGYANEGHDSGHPDYGDIGRRMGGAKDMVTMLEEGQEYGAEFGIHVNASEFYPEAKAFNEDMVSRGAKGTNGEPGGLDYRWNYLDQGIGINGVYDLASGNRMERWDKLYAQVQDKLDYVYVDVWGNNTSGTEDAWQTRKLSNEITGHDWRIVHEWGYANEWDSTFQHWVSDFGYGGYDQKGQLNSAIMRFMLNSYKDSFVPDFPTYGGAANAPLLGGPVMQGFEGWQGDVEYDLFIDTQYNQMMPTKFLQHYDIMKWVDNDEAVTIPYGTTSGGFSESQTSRWTPEVQITLQSQDRADTVVVTRGSDEEINETYAYATTEERLEYRSRTITLNGKTILTGASNPGDFTSNAPGGNMKYLLPWYWNINGDTVAAADEKLYHYNVVGGESTWELPDGWTNLANVKVYKLTDQGRTEERTVAVNSGSITLTGIEAETPYVVVKGENGAAAPVVEFTAKGMHLKDVSFNGALTDSWTVTGDAEVVRTARQIPMLKMGGEASVSQTMTDLTAGTRYAVYVGVDNRSDARAAITVSDADGKVLAANYTQRSILRNYVGSYVHRNAHPTEKGASYFQNMYIFFTAPESGELTLTLSREAGEGNTYFDDVRVVENPSDHYEYDENGSVKSFTQDFEHVAQGLFPFVVGPGQGDTDGRTHLSEKHEPFTQAGWDVKKVSDVLEGDWSVKINGLTERNGVIYQTIPQNFRFEPDVTYTITFKYQMGSEGTYDVVYGSGEGGKLVAVPLEKAQGETKTCTFSLFGAEDGQTWFGIRSTARAADNQGTSGGAATFGGYMDFILDDLTISVSKAQKKALSELVTQADSMLEIDYSGDWADFQTKLAEAKTVLENIEAEQTAVDDAKTALELAIAALVKYDTTLTLTVTDADGKPIEGASIILEDASYIPTGATGVTGADGVYQFPWLSAVAYQVKIVAVGYDVATVNTGALTPGEAKAEEVTLTARTEPTYENTFDGGDISMIAPLKGNVGGGKNEDIEAVNHNGSDAVKITFNVADRNHVVDTGVLMTDGTVEMDVTPLGANLRCGMVHRGVDAKNFNYVGPYDAPAWNSYTFNNGVEDYSVGQTAAGPNLATGVTRNVKLTIDGDKLTLLVDGVMVMDEAPLKNSAAAAGYVGIYNMANAGNSFIVDNLRVTSDTAVVTAALRALYTTCKDTTDDGYTSASWTAFQTALTAAEAVLADNTAAQEAVDAALAALQSAFDGLTFPSGGGSSSNTTTTTEKNGDGSTTKTVTNKKTGSVTETTTYPDGTKIVATTPKDGKTSIEVTVPKDKAQVTVTIPTGGKPAPGEVAVIVREDGTREIIKTSVSTEDGLRITLTEGAKLEIIDNSKAFGDVADSHWASEAVQFVASRDLFNGVGQDSFDLAGNMTRAMLVTVLARLDGQDTTGGETWDSVGVAWAKENGITDGADMGDSITREQLAVMLYRYAKAEAADGMALAEFSDGADVSGWAAEAMNWAVAKGIITGNGVGKLDPGGTATRAEVAVMLQRFITL